MKFSALFALILSAAVMSSPTHCWAAQGKKPEATKPVKIRLSLAPDALYTDLAKAKGRLDYQVNKKQKDLKAMVHVPISTTLGIADKATAKAAAIHAEFLHADGTVYADCTLKYDGGDDNDTVVTTDDAFNFKLHLKNQGKKEVKGTCGGTIPAMVKGDTVKVYLLTAAPARLDFMASK
jgi:hypothetical protein